MGLRNYNRLRRKVRYLRDNLGDAAADAVERGAQGMTAEMKANVTQKNAVWKLNLFGAIAYSEMATDSYTSYQIVADVPYAAFVEFGTGPRGDPTAPLRFQFASPSHTPELTQDILSWVMTKPMFFGTRSQSTAWAIAQKIAEEGTRPKPFLRPAWFKQKPLMLQYVKASVKSVIRRA